VVERELEIVNRLGLHARAAAKFVKVASGFASEITLARGAREVNGKSIMGVMMLAAARGTRLRLRAEGPDEEAAVEALSRLVAERFGEDE
jgi:phosphocarrier protein